MLPPVSLWIDIARDLHLTRLPHFGDLASKRTIKDVLTAYGMSQADLAELMLEPDFEAAGVTAAEQLDIFQDNASHVMTMRDMAADFARESYRRVKSLLPTLELRDIVSYQALLLKSAGWSDPAPPAPRNADAPGYGNPGVNIQINIPELPKLAHLSATIAPPPVPVLPIPLENVPPQPVLDVSHPSLSHSYE